MKKLIPFFALLASFAFFTPACSGDDDDVNLNDYQDWRAQNEAWLEELKQRTNADGTPYYSVVSPDWNPDVYILMHFFNNRSETADNLSPLFTSTVDVIYKGYDCEDEPFDSSTNINAYGRLGVQRFRANNTIQGWSIALENMHVGDTAEVIIPYNVAYGTQLYGTILPYSCLRFNMRLYDIYRYEASPY